MACVLTGMLPVFLALLLIEINEAKVRPVKRPVSRCASAKSDPYWWRRT